MTDGFVVVLNAIDEKVIGAPPEEWEARYFTLTQLERDLYDINSLNFEYVSGGLATYFRNSAGRHWKQTLAALERVGATEALEVLRKACAAFPGGNPSDDPTELERQANDPALRSQLKNIAGFDDNVLMEALEDYWRANTSGGRWITRRK